MYYPWTWHDRSQKPPEEGLKGSKFGLHYPLPEVYCDGTQGLKCSIGALKNGLATDWFTNYTFITTEPTQPVGNKKQRTYPWAAPGTALTYGEGCGLNGGNPYPQGCNHPEVDTNPYGTCCSFGGGTDSIKINRPGYNIQSVTKIYIYLFLKYVFFADISGTT